ncbi:MAG TPA: SRPBCC domain-containing protein [Gemmatimonadales bacterium]|nr:SRPBCC domain-containing protein [Gemmatimonadales bacterium]
MTTLTVRKSIRATPERLFAAWTTPSELVHWWGPDGVTCVDPAVDLRPGGRYRIGNRFPDGSVHWITGEFAVVDPPHRLVYTWRLDEQGDAERVTVRFEGHGEHTEVSVLHEQIADARARDGHEAGWEGCLQRLATYLR